MDLPKLVIGNQIRLKQIMINLTKNALKSIENASGKVNIFAAYDSVNQLLKVHVRSSSA